MQVRELQHLPFKGADHGDVPAASIEITIHPPDAVPGIWARENSVQHGLLD